MCSGLNHFWLRILKKTLTRERTKCQQWGVQNAETNVTVTRSIFYIQVYGYNPAHKSKHKMETDTKVYESNGFILHEVQIWNNESMRFS